MSQYGDKDVSEADRLFSQSSYSSLSSSTLSFSQSAPRTRITQTKTTTSPIMSTRTTMTTPQVTTSTSQSHPRQRAIPRADQHPRQLDIPLLHQRPTPRVNQPETRHDSHPLDPLGPMKNSMKLKMTMGIRPKRRLKRFTFPA